MEEVPHDVLLDHILPRVLPKSIGRFRSVSKEWHSSLTSDTFQKSYIHHHQNNIKLLLLSKTKTSSFEFTTLDCEAPPTDDGLIPTRRPLPLFGDTTPPYVVRILTSFHGLVCLGILKDIDDYLHFGLDFEDNFYYPDLILWNPVTNEYKRLPKSDVPTAHNNKTRFGLYYGCSEDDYKLLSIHESDTYVYIYSMKSDSWRKVDAFQSTYILNDWSWPGWSRGTYLNENLYFVQNHQDNRSSIIRFDTKTERLSKIEVPNVEFLDVHNYSATIMVKSDRIHVCVKYNIVDDGATIITLWKLDEYDNLKEVEERTSQVYDKDFMTCVRPFYLMKNENWLMMEKRWRCSDKHKIYKVSLNDDDDYESEYVKKVRVDGKYNIVLGEGRNIETFVSPNRYIK